MKLRRLVVLATVAVFGTACANAASTGPGTGGGGIDHPTDPSVPLLSITYEGGFVAPATLYERLPIFALHGDGSVITPGAQTAIYPGSALPPIFTQPLSEEGIQAVLAAGLAAHLDRDGDYSDLGQMGVADAATTTFTFTVDGTTHHVTAYALGMEGEQQPGQSDAMWQMREGLQELVTKIGDPASLVPAGSLGDPVPYQGEAGQLLVGPYRPDPQLTEPRVDWPLATPLATLGESMAGLDEGTRCAVLSGEDWTTVRALAANANQLTPWVSGGQRYSIAFRPLLPDEPGCRAS